MTQQHTNPSLEEVAVRWQELAAGPISQILHSHGAGGTLSRLGLQEVTVAVAQGGLQGATVPPALGGLGLPAPAVGIMAEALGPVLGFTAFNVVPRAVAAFGTDAARREILPRLLSGEWLGCAAISEPEVGSDAGSVSATAHRAGDRYVINGTKSWVLGASAARIANALLVTDPAAGSRGLSRILVDLDQPGVHVQDLPMHGATALTIGQITFSEAIAPVDYLLGEEGKGFGLTLRGLESSRASVASHAVGIAQAALDAAIGWAKTRKQFGRPVGGFQSVQDMIARMSAETDAARLLTRRAWNAIDSGERAAISASTAKFYAVETAIRVTQQAMELFGAAGLRDDFAVKRLHGYALGLAAPDGTLQINRLILARELLGISAFS